MDLALNNQQRLIYHKKPTNQPSMFQCVNKHGVFCKLPEYYGKSKNQKRPTFIVAPFHTIITSIKINSLKPLYKKKKRKAITLEELLKTDPNLKTSYKHCFFNKK